MNVNAGEGSVLKTIHSWRNELNADLQNNVHILRIYQKLFVLLHNIKGNLSIYKLSHSQSKTVNDCLDTIRALAYSVSKVSPEKEDEFRQFVRSFQSIEDLLVFLKTCNLEPHIDLESDESMAIFLMFQKKFPQSLLDSLGKARLFQAFSENFDIYLKTYEIALSSLIELEETFDDLFALKQGLPVTKVLSLAKNQSHIEATFVGACPGTEQNRNTLLTLGWTFLTSVS